MERFLRHVAACNTLAPPAGRMPFRIGGETIGWLAPAVARALRDIPAEIAFEGDGATLPARCHTPAARSEALETAARALAARGLFRWRDEPFDLRARLGGPVLATLDRGALPAFGAISQGVHVNGLVRRADGLHLWVGWRSRRKPLAPGQLDNVVAGGVPAGHTPEQTLVKEAAEEASIPAALARTARPVGAVSYAMRSEDDGMRRDVLHCYDLDLPEGFVPAPNDDEVERFELLPAAEVLARVRDTDTVKFNVNLVLIDLFLREGLLDAESEAGRRLRAGLSRPL